MKSIVLKSLVFIPILLFVDYLIMLVLGCTACLFGFTSNFYDCTFCVIGKVLLLLSLMVFLVLLIPDIKAELKKI